MIQEIYKPLPEDRERVKPHPDKLKISGDGVFATLQGEGITAGLPSVFLRLHYCNLACGALGGWLCDTWYTWDPSKREFWQEPQDWSYEETAARIRDAWELAFSDQHQKRLVITGGEPLLQQRKIIRLLQELPEWEVEIETNGTILPAPELGSCQFNCSPKLNNSGNTLERRYKPNVLETINNLPKSQFKFVVICESDFYEIDKIIKGCSLSPEKILIMPEGHTREEVDTHLGLIREAVESRGWRVALRNQLIWFGPKRRT